MFGNNRRRLSKLETHGGIRAPATIIDAHQTHMSITNGSSSIVADTTIIWKLVLEVKPEGQPSFQAKLEQRYPQMGGPCNGDDVFVYYDPSKLALDDSAGAELQAGLARIDQRRHQELGSAVADAMSRLDHAAIGDPAETAAAFDKDPHAAAEAAKARVRAAMAQPGIADALGSGRLVIQPGANIVFGGGAAPSPVDPIDKLKELADLRDRGVLTDDEFQTQKHKLLGECETGSKP